MLIRIAFFRQHVIIIIYIAILDVINEIRVDLPQGEKIRMLMAHVFAYWTLSGSKHYRKKATDPNDKAATEKKNKALLQPHAGQIVGILRLLGLDEERPTTPLISQAGEFILTAPFI